MILLLIPKTLKAGVINSQVMPFATYLRSVGKEVKLLFYRNSNFADFSDDKDVYYVGSKRELRFYISSAQYIYVRNVYDFLTTFRFKSLRGYRLKIFYDFRGLSSEESYLNSNSLIKKLALNVLQFLAYKRADCVGAVSVALASELKKRYGNRNVYVTPCCISSTTHLEDILTAKENSTNEVVKFVYVGGLSKWQCFDRTIMLYKELSKVIKGALTVITPDKEEALRILQQEGLDSEVEVLSLTQKEVLSLLPTFDFGFLIRDDIKVNNVASPIKFLEYVSNGVFPIMTWGIGDYSNLIRDTGLGVVISNDNYEKLEHLLKQLYQNETKIGELVELARFYNWDNYMPNHPLTIGF